MRRIVEDLLWLAASTLSRVAECRVDRSGHHRSVGGGALRLGDGDAVPVRHRGRPESVLLVSLPAEWLDRLVGVLVDNACRHARTAVRVEARAIEEGRAEFSVSDDGEGSGGRAPPALPPVPSGTSTARAPDWGWPSRTRSCGPPRGAGASPILRRSARFAVVWPLGRGRVPAPRAPASTPHPRLRSDRKRPGSQRRPTISRIRSAGDADVPAGARPQHCCRRALLQRSELTPAQTREPTVCREPTGPGAQRG